MSCLRDGTLKQGPAKMIREVCAWGRLLAAMVPALNCHLLGAQELGSSHGFAGCPGWGSWARMPYNGKVVLQRQNMIFLFSCHLIHLSKIIPFLVCSFHFSPWCSYWEGRCRLLIGFLPRLPNWGPQEPPPSRSLSPWRITNTAAHQGRAFSLLMNLWPPQFADFQGSLPTSPAWPLRTLPSWQRR